MQEIREVLERLAQALENDSEKSATRLVRSALLASDEDLAAFLRSNELWGGAGSIADQAMIDAPETVRRDYFALMSGLGDLQMAKGVVNGRTAFWTEAFRSWCS